MMNYYCTLFDSYYLSRGLVMIDSLYKYTSSFHLYIFAFDDLSYRVLSDLKLKNITVISLEEFETPQLLEVKKERSKAEYCWTCTPSIIKHVIDNYGVAECTYIDADLAFYQDPSVLFSEINQATTTLITEHRYSFIERIYEEKRAGRFCVQFIYFNNQDESKKILNHWADQCIEWCYNRYEEGKFGDQKYLDVWPSKYKGVHILEYEGGGVAPWNVKKYTFSGDHNAPTIMKKKTKETFNLVFFHFQSLKVRDYIIFDLGWHYINKKIRKLIYREYIKKLVDTEKMLSARYEHYTTSFYTPVNNTLKDRFKNVFKWITGYNIYKL